MSIVLVTEKAAVIMHALFIDLESSTSVNKGTCKARVQPGDNAH